MSRHAPVNLKTACGMGSCGGRFRSVSTGMKHVQKHRPVIGPRGNDEPIWRVAWTRDGEIREVLSGPLPNADIPRSESSPAPHVSGFGAEMVSGHGGAL